MCVCVCVHVSMTVCEVKVVSRHMQLSSRAGFRCTMHRICAPQGALVFSLIMKLMVAGTLYTAGFYVHVHIHNIIHTHARVQLQVSETCHNNYCYITLSPFLTAVVRIPFTSEPHPGSVTQYA